MTFAIVKHLGVIACSINFYNIFKVIVELLYILNKLFTWINPIAFIKLFFPGVQLQGNQVS